MPITAIAFSVPLLGETVTATQIWGVSLFLPGSFWPDPGRNFFEHPLPFQREAGRDFSRSPDLSDSAASLRERAKWIVFVFNLLRYALCSMRYAIFWKGAVKWII